MSKLRLMVKKASGSEHRAKLKKVTGVGLVAGAMIIGLGTSQVTFADEVGTSSTNSTVVSSESATSDSTLATTTTSAENEAKAVDSTTTATISTTTETDGVSPADAGRYSYNVDTTLNAPAKEGDYVEYDFHNLPHSGLDGKSVSIADGTVIGTLSKVSSSSNRSKEVNGSEEEKNNVNVGSDDSKYRVVFHNSVENLSNIAYSFGLVNGTNVFTYVSKDSPMTSSISANGKEVVNHTTTIKALPEEQQSKPVIYQSSSYGTYTSSGVDGTLYNHNIANSNENPIKAGDILTSTLGDNAGIVFDKTSAKVGQVFSIKDVGSNNSLARSNGNNVLLFDNSEYRFEVVSIDDNTVTYKALDDFKAVDGRYGGLPLKFIVTDEKIIDLANNQLKVPSYTSTVKSADGTVKSTNTEAVTIPITGTTVSASAIVVPRSNVNVEYVTDTGEVLEAKNTVLSQAKVGTDYITEAKTFENYELVATPSNATGKVTVDDTTVTYVYKKKTGSVYEDNFIESSSTKLTETQTVVSNGLVGSDYDSSKQDEVITLSNGKSYELVSKADNSVGKVTTADTFLKNYYKEIKGSVIVKYVDVAGKTIKESVVDTAESSTGVAYDTTDNKLSVIRIKNSDNVLVNFNFKELAKDSASENGIVKKGETVVTYVYEQEAKSKVIVHYVDEKGNKVADDVKDVSDVIVGTDYDTRDNKPAIIEKDGIKYRLVSSKTVGSETGKTTESDIEVTYVYHMPTTEWVEQVNGKTVKVLKEKTDGTFEHGSFDGYDFVSTREDPETGDLVHIFEQKKVPTVPEQPSNNVETPTPRPMSMSRVEKNHVSLPETGQKSNVGLSVVGAIIGSLGFVGLKKKKEN